jgi:hypothetical protein
MKRDWGLVRLLLLEIESGERPAGLEQYSEEQILYHCELLKESDLIIASVVTGGEGKAIGARIERLTWKGHDLLDSIRNETIWNQTQAVVREATVSATADMLKDACKWVTSTAFEAAAKAMLKP